MLSITGVNQYSSVSHDDDAGTWFLSVRSHQYPHFCFFSFQSTQQLIYYIYTTVHLPGINNQDQQKQITEEY